MNSTDERIDEIVLLLRKLGLPFLKRLEERDPQFRALSSLKGICSRIVPAVACLNALISYMLTCRGEEYWLEFSSYLRRELTGCYIEDKDYIKISNLIDLVIRFVRFSKCNKRFRKLKVARLRRIARNPEANMLLDTEFFINNTTGFWESLAKLVGAKPESKTILFSIKMYYYGLRSCLELDITLPYEIPLPVDIRIAKLTKACGLIDHIVNYRTVQNIWGEISRLSRIPPLHLDVLLWRLGRYIDQKDLWTIAKEFSYDNAIDYHLALRIVKTFIKD